MLTRKIVEGFQSIEVPIGAVASKVIEILISIRDPQSNIEVLTAYLNGITELDISQTKLTPKDIENLALALKENKTLKTLDLAENKISSDSIVYIAQALTVNNTLECLILWNNALDATGASHLANALKVNYGLRRLNLGRNPIGDEGLNSLATAIRSITHRYVERSLLNVNENESQKTQQEINTFLQEAFNFHAQQMNRSKISSSLLWSYSKYTLGAATITAISLGIYITYHYMRRAR